jgi:hypothetical protein
MGCYRWGPTFWSRRTSHLVHLSTRGPRFRVRPGSDKQLELDARYQAPLRTYSAIVILFIVESYKLLHGGRSVPLSTVFSSGSMGTMSTWTWCSFLVLWLLCYLSSARCDLMDMGWVIWFMCFWLTSWLKILPVLLFADTGEGCPVD